MNQLKETAQIVNDYAFKAVLYARRLHDSNANDATHRSIHLNITFCISQIVHHCNAIFRILL